MFFLLLIDHNSVLNLSLTLTRIFPDLGSQEGTQRIMASVWASASSLLPYFSLSLSRGLGKLNASGNGQFAFCMLIFPKHD